MASKGRDKAKNWSPEISLGNFWAPEPVTRPETNHQKFSLGNFWAPEAITSPDTGPLRLLLVHFWAREAFTRQNACRQRFSLGHSWAPEAVTRPDTGHQSLQTANLQAGRNFLNSLAGWLAKPPQVRYCSVVFLFRYKIENKLRKRAMFRTPPRG